MPAPGAGSGVRAGRPYHSRVDPVGVEQLLAQEVVVGTGWASVLGEGVAAPEALRMRPVVLGEADAGIAAVEDVLAVRLGQVGEELGDGAEVLMDVAVDHATTSGLVGAGDEE